MLGHLPRLAPNKFLFFIEKSKIKKGKNKKDGIKSSPSHFVSFPKSQPLIQSNRRNFERENPNNFKSLNMKASPNNSSESFATRFSFANVM
jgi:hypothetical protein